MSFYPKLGIMGLVLLVLLSAGTFAQSLDYIYRSNDTVVLTRQCLNPSTANGLCTQNATCQISVLNPQNNIIVLNQNMTNTQSQMNYTINNLTSDGIYRVSMGCGDINQSGYDAFFFGMDPQGNDYRGSQLPYFTLGLIAILFVLFLVLAFLLTDALKVTFALLSILLIPIALWASNYFAVNSFAGNNITSMLQGAYNISLIGFFGMLLFAMWTVTMGLKLKPNKIKIPASSAYATRKNNIDETDEPEED